MIGQSNYFGFGFTTQLKTALLIEKKNNSKAKGMYRCIQLFQLRLSDQPKLTQQDRRVVGVVANQS